MYLPDEPTVRKCRSSAGDLSCWYWFRRGDLGLLLMGLVLYQAGRAYTLFLNSALDVLLPLNHLQDPGWTVPASWI